MMRTLNTFAVDLIQIPTMADLFWYVAQNVVGKLSFVDCVIYQADEAQTCLRQVAAWGEKNPFGRSILNPLVIPFGRGITGTAASTKSPIIVADILVDQNYIPDTQPARSEICVPLVFRGQVVGVIDCEHPEPNAFGEAELEILSTVAAMTGAKLELLAESQRSVQRYTDLVRAHAQLMQEIDYRKALEAKLFEARRLEAIGKLAGRFAHEFNNLLTVVIGNLDLLDLEDLSAEARCCLEDARHSADRGAGLVRDMLAFARRTRLEPTDMDLNDVVTSFSAALEKARAARLELDLSEDLWRIQADRKAVEHALGNLVANAFDAMGPHGHVLVQTENMLRTMSDNLNGTDSLPPGRYVRLSVIDTGIGIPADRMTQIFDPFYSSKPVGEGTGLGLSIVMGLAQQSGGSITVTSEVDKGSTFHLCLPALT